MNNRCLGYKPPNLTPSRAADLVCRKKFYELHVLKNNPGEAFSQPLVFGQAVHNVLKHVYSPANGVVPGAVDIEAVARRVFQGLAYPDPDDRDHDRNRCVDMVRAYVAQNRGKFTTLGVEIFADVALSNANGNPVLTLGAKFDHLLVRTDMPSCLVVRDYKTGKPGSADMDAACIMLAIARKRYPTYETCLVEFDWIASSGLVQRVTVTLAEVKEVWKDLKAAATRVYRASEFPAEPGEHCLFCPLKSECQPDAQATDEEIDALFE